jgi:hypothetical protein
MTINLRTQLIKSTIAIALIGTLATPFLLASCNETNKEGEKEKNFTDKIIQAYEEMDTYLQNNAVPVASGDDVDFSSSTKKEAMLKYLDDNFDERLLFNSELLYSWRTLKLLVEIAKNDYTIEDSEIVKIKIYSFDFTHSGDSFILTMDSENTMRDDGYVVRYKQTHSCSRTGLVVTTMDKMADYSANIETLAKVAGGGLSTDIPPINISSHAAVESSSNHERWIN